MSVLIKRISGKILSRVIALPDKMKNEDLEITIIPVNKKRKQFSKLYTAPLKVNKITIPSRESLNER